MSSLFALSLLSGAVTSPAAVPVPPGSGQVRATVAPDGTAGLLSATASATPTTGHAPLDVHFKGTASGGKSPYSYRWNFGGTATSSSSSPSHTYSYSGTYDATLTVTDAAKATATSHLKITVWTRTNPLAAVAGASKLLGLSPLTVTFSGSASGGTTPYAYSWRFGDGGTSTGQNPVHIYLRSGTFAAELTVTDAASSTATSNVSIVVSPSVAGVASTLLAGTPDAVTPSTFWSVNGDTRTTTGISTEKAVDSFLASTPFTWVRYGPSTDSCNSSTDVFHNDDGTTSSGCGYDLSSLKTWCDSTTPHCHVILGLPGENNNSREDAAIAKYIVDTIGLQPDFWYIGNEPMGWTHFGIAWSSWKTTDHSTATPMAYAFDVKAAIAAVKAVDPSAKFLGIEAACSCNTAWFQDVVEVDGSSVYGIAYHNYPSVSSTSETLSQFYGTLSGATNISSNLAKVRSAITGHCTGCSTMPIWVNEYNAGPGWAPSNYAGTYQNAVFLAASEIQALTANVSQLTIYDLQTPGSGSASYGFAMLNGNDVVGPCGLVYSDLLSKMVEGTVYGSVVRTSVGGVWGLVSKNATTESLLVVNTNQSSAVALSLVGAFTTGVSGSIHSWNATSGGAPSAKSAVVQAAYSIPAQGILLLTVPLP